MVYITYNSPERYRQMTFEEMMMGDAFPIESLRSGGKGATHTVVVDKVPRRIMKITDVSKMIYDMAAFNHRYSELMTVSPRSELYDHFEIPKKTGGLRPIDAPCPELKKALAELKELWSGWMFADHHTCAFAYINQRSVYEVAAKHQRFNAWWFASFDFHGFFPSTTPKFVLSQLSQIYPFSLVLAYPTGRREFEKALDLCFLNGGLPQGTPISPFITNVMMIPFDHKLARLLNNFDSGKKNANGNPITDRICYTRYADDIDISCRVMFNYKRVEREIVRLLQEMNAPFTLNEKRPSSTPAPDATGFSVSCSIRTTTSRSVTARTRSSKRCWIPTARTALKERSGAWKICRSCAGTSPGTRAWNPARSSTFSPSMAASTD